MKQISMDYTEYQEELKVEFRKGEINGMNLICNAVLDQIRTGGQNIKIKETRVNDDLKKFFDELKIALEGKQRA